MSEPHRKGTWESARAPRFYRFDYYFQGFLKYLLRPFSISLPSALWFRKTMNPDVSMYWATRSSVHSFTHTAHLFACSALLTCLLAPPSSLVCLLRPARALRCANLFACFLTHSLACGKVNDSMAIFAVVFLFWTLGNPCLSPSLPFPTLYCSLFLFIPSFFFLVLQFSFSCDFDFFKFRFGFNSNPFYESFISIFVCFSSSLFVFSSFYPGLCWSRVVKALSSVERE